MGSLMKSKTTTTNSSTTTNPWEPAQDSLKKVLSEENNWYDSAKNTGYISSSGDMSGNYADYLNALSGITNSTQTGTNNLLSQAGTSGTSALNGYTSAANGGLNYSTSDIANAAKSLYNSDLVNSQIDSANRQIDNTLNENTLTGIDRNAVGSGNMGSSRAGIAQAVAQREAAQLKSDNANTITGNAYNNAISTAGNTLSNNVQTQMAGISGNANLSNSLANQAANYSTATTNSISPLLQSSQLNQSITSANQADQIGSRDYIANLLSQYYTPTATAIGSAGGSGTGSQQTPGTSTFSSLLAGGQAAGNMYQAFSDINLKTNIEYVGEYKGHNIYTWDWNEAGESVASPRQPTFGVIAQEAMEITPEAVTMGDDGYYRVDYNKLFGGIDG